MSEPSITLDQLINSIKANKGIIPSMNIDLTYLDLVVTEIESLRSENDRLDKILDAWVEATDVISPGEHEPEAMKRRFEQVKEMADMAAQSLVTIADLRKQLEDCRELPITVTSTPLSLESMIISIVTKMQPANAEQIREEIDPWLKENKYEPTEFRRALWKLLAEGKINMSDKRLLEVPTKQDKPMWIDIINGWSDHGYNELAWAAAQGEKESINTLINHTTELRKEIKEYKNAISNQLQDYKAFRDLNMEVEQLQQQLKNLAEACRMEVDQNIHPLVNEALSDID